MKPDQTNLNKELWSRIESFNFDFPISAYNFSTRLAAENKWTIYFTQKVILEYKKFMYLAAGANAMISPSETVDTVWHLHLIFTKSYTDFGNLLGKTIHHIPSTRAADEQAKFIQAKVNTERLYRKTFGDMPPDIWLHDDMYQPIGWEKKEFNQTLFIIKGSIVAAILLIPLYFLLLPLYVHLNNPYFLIGYILLIGLTFLCLYKHDTVYLHNLLSEVKDGSFLHHLQPGEVICMKTQQAAAIVHNGVNNLVEEGEVEIASDGTLHNTGYSNINTIEAFAIKEAISEAGGFRYEILLKHILSKATFSNTISTIKELQKRFRESRAFGRLFRTNFIAFAALFLPGVVRLMTGVELGKPVTFLLFTLFFLFLCIGGALGRLSKFLFTNVIPGWYKYHLLPDNPDTDIQRWLYCLSGTGALSASLSPLVISLEKNNSSSGGDGGSSCGSGGGCGGCGGD